MKRFSLYKNNDIKGQTLVRLPASTYKEDQCQILIEGHVDMVLECGNKPKPVQLTISPSSSLKLQIIGPKTNTDWRLKMQLADSAIVEAWMVDLGSYEGQITVNGDLKGSGSVLDWHLASLAHGQDKKTYAIYFIHDGGHSQARMTNHGIIEQGAKLTFTGSSHILKGATDSATHQEARIIVFDPNGVGRADPVLAIDENEVSASHAATVGKINEEHLFYLQSRGLSEDEARRLITYGYLRPAIEQFTDATTKTRLSQTLEARL